MEYLEGIIGAAVGIVAGYGGMQATVRGLRSRVSELEDQLRDLPKNFIPRTEGDERLRAIEANTATTLSLVHHILLRNTGPLAELEAMAAAPRIDLEQATTLPAVRAFLNTIGWSEGTSTQKGTKCAGYDEIVIGVDDQEEIFTDFSTHPFATGRPPKLIRYAHGPIPALYSTAAGRYQLLARFWGPYKTLLNLPDFSPHSQDMIALRQLEERGALQLILSGEIETAITYAASIWASLPGNHYNQGGHDMETVLAKYQQFVAGKE